MVPTMIQMIPMPINWTTTIMVITMNAEILDHVNAQSVMELTMVEVAAINTVAILAHLE